MNYSLNSGYGQLLGAQIASAVGPVFGKIKVVIASGDEQYKINMLRDIFIPDPDGKVRFYSDSGSGTTSGLELAYADCTSNADDVILLAGNASHTLKAGIAWSKNRIHVIGMDGGGRLTDAGAKVSSSATDTTGYLLKVTGTRNSFKNIKFIQNSTDAAALTVVQMGGVNTLWEKCQFTFGVITRLGATTTYEVINGEAGGTFIDCEFGAMTLLTSAARTVMLIKVVTAGQQFKQNRFRGCTWMISSSSSTAVLLQPNANTDILFGNLFEDCEFYASVDASGGAIITNAVQSISGLAAGTLAFQRIGVHFCTNFCASVVTNIEVCGNPVFTSNAFEGGAPA